MGQNKHWSGNDKGLINVAVARLSAIGDVAMSIPVLYSACRCYKDIHFIFITRISMKSMFINPPENLTVIGVDLKTDYVGIKGMRRLVNEIIKDYDVDMFVDLHNVLRTRAMRIFFRLHGVKTVKIHKGRMGKRALTRRFAKRMLPLISQRARYRQAFFNAGLPIDYRFDGLFGGHSKSDESLFAEIVKPKAKDESWVGVAPFAAHKGKIYPVDKLHQSLSLLKQQRPDVRFFFFGGGGYEQQVMQDWADEFEGSVLLAGKHYGFAAELALINHLDVMITMDSANMHLASIVSTPTVSIWGATHPYCGFLGWHQDESNIIQQPLSCRPCSVFGNKPCYRGDYACLTTIAPATVTSRILEKLS